MLRFSNNYIADVLTLESRSDRHEGAADGAVDCELGALGASSVARSGSRSLPAPKTPTPLFSGSGLTPENLISASELASLLAYQYRDTRRFPAFYGSLVVPRDAPFQFLRTGTPDWLDRVALKTGTMDTPHSVCESRVICAEDGGWMAVRRHRERRREDAPGAVVPRDGGGDGDIEAFLEKY